MADLKISQLPEVTAPIQGDVLPIVNSSATKKVTLSNLSNSLPIHTFLQSASGFWQNTYSTVQATSAQWNIDNSTDTAVRSLTGSWQDTFNTVQATSGNWQSTYNTFASVSAKVGTYIPLSFSNLNNFDVPGDGAVRSLGDLVGMTVIFHPEANFTKGLCIAEDDTNWYFDVQLHLAAQYGGVTIDTGINLDYASSAGSFNTDIFAAATRYLETNANYETHYRRFQFFVPKNYLSAPTRYIRFNIIARRPTTAPGNTGIISGGSIKFLTIT